MPVTQFIETSESRSATLHRKGKRADSTVTVNYLAFGTSVDTEVHTYANTFFSNNRFYAIGDYTFMVEQYSVEYIGDECFQVTATYTKTGQDNEEQEAPLRRTRSFDTGGGSQHLTQGLPVGSGNTLDFERRFPATGPNQSGAIGVDGDSVAGVDVVVPQLQWTETYDVPSTYVTAAYIRSVATLTGTTNTAAFRGFYPGEVLFLGASGNQEWDEEKGDGPWSLSFKFTASPNAGPTYNAATGSRTDSVEPITVGSITGITKRGHEYLWVRYESDVEGTSLLKKPKMVYVNKVYRDGDFSGLGIGS
jgi:hypothetical protein